MKFATFRTLALGLAALTLAVGCSSATSSSPSPTPTPGPALFASSTLAAHQAVLKSDMGGGATITVGTPSSASFAAYPQYWDGAVSWVGVPSGGSGQFDLSGVKTIKFQIKSASIKPEQLALFLQWGSATAHVGNEYTVPLKVSSSVTDAAGAAVDLGVTDITGWTTVSFDLTTIPEGGTTAGKLNTGEPTRYDNSANAPMTPGHFAAGQGDGSTHVDTPLAIKWYGSASAATNSGPLAAGDSYQIGNIQFLDASGNEVNIAAGITWPVLGPTAVTAAPTLASNKVISLYTSSGTYTSVAMTDWQAAWSSNATMGDDTSSVSGKTLKKLTFSTVTGYDGADIATLQDISALADKKLHLDYYSPNGAGLSVKVVDFSAGSYNNGTGVVDTGALSVGTVVQGSWQSVDLDVSNLTDKKYIAQLVFVATGTQASQSFWVDNIYFH
ncbi:MAG TPA: hypothetical protein VMB23_08375 [Spirochaetia bacterium]|nr:hypothetical protein [Spirochaetia bacterium]